MFNIAEFSSTFAQNGGGQRTTLFSVDIPIPRGLLAASPITNDAFTSTQRNLKMYCEAANYPGLQFATSPIRRYGYGPIEEKPYLPLFAPADLVFIADGNGAIWNYFQAWMKFINNFDSRYGMNKATGFASHNGVISPTAFPYEGNYKEDYVVDVAITLYNPSGVTTTQLILRDAFPKFVGDASLNWGDFNNLMRIPVQFTFFDWYNRQMVGDGSLEFQELQSTIDAVNSLNINRNTTQVTTDNSYAAVAQRLINQIK